PNPYWFSMHGILSARSVRARVLGTQAKLRLCGRLRQKAVRRGRRQILSQEDCSSVCEKRHKHRPEIASRGYDRAGTRAGAFAFEVLAFCEGGACGRRRGQIPATNTSGKTSRTGAGE